VGGRLAADALAEGSVKAISRTEIKMKRTALILDMLPPLNLDQTGNYYSFYLEQRLKSVSTVREKNH
jgi:hypothetical protein